MVAVLVFVCQGVRAQPASPTRSAAVTIDQAVQEAIDHNLNLLAERFNLQVADAARLTASLRPNPVVTASVTRPDQPLVDAGISPYEQVFRTDVVIERGAKRERRIDQADLAKSVSEMQLLDATRTLVLGVEGAFVGVQVGKLNVALARDNLAAFNSVVAINTERVRTGDLSQMELARSRLAALQFQNDVRQQETTLSAARTRLATLLGRDAAAGEPDAIGDLRHDTDVPGYEALKGRALASRPDLLAARIDQARSTADTRLQIANGIVDYTVSGEYHRQEGTSARGNAYAVFFSAPLPLFNRNQGEIARAQAEDRQLQTKVEALELEIGSEVATAYTQYTAARAIVDTIEQQMLTQAHDVRAATEYAYRRGEASFVELLDAVRAFNDTSQSYNDARADYARSLYTLDSISGRVNP
ncbi:MAG TPA: TolC family protein [Vicinamibacterales bacterium]|jgi:cobalt-zinc-cadmium efflux system outer membrane protein|nr:TolC family protein [Vicinamibacterales bacterium]